MKLILVHLIFGALARHSTAQDPHEPFDPHEATSDSQVRRLSAKQTTPAGSMDEFLATIKKSRSLKEYTPRETKRYKNIIMMIPDGCDEGVQSMAHLYKGADLQVDLMDSTAVTSHMANSMITGSAAAATAFSTGHKTTVRFLSIGPRTEDLLSLYAPVEMPPPYAPMATILEAAKYLGKGTGLVATSRISHATPAAFACHIDDRGKDNDIMEHIVYNNVDVVMGGGKRHLLPGTDCPNGVDGGKRTDCQDLQQVLRDRDYSIVETRDELLNIPDTEENVYGMFDMSHMQPDVDRKHFAPDQPSIAEMTQASIDVLSKKENGFFLMVEGSQVDWAGHNNDPLYMMTDFVAFDDAVKVAVDFAKQDGETLVLVFPDHNTGGPKIGNYGHGYTDVTLEEIREPFLGMSMTANGVVSHVPEENTTSQDLIDAVKAHWDLDITDDDVKDIYEYKEKADQSLSYSMARLLSERYTYIGWTTHGHNGETVPLWVYGMDVPSHVIDNTDLALIAAAGFGIDLDSLTQELYVESNTTGLGGKVNTTDTSNPIFELPDGTIFPIGKDYMINAAGEKVALDGLTVYAPETGKLYYSSKAVSILRDQQHVSKVIFTEIQDREVQTLEDSACDTDDVEEAAIIVGVVLGIVCVVLAVLLAYVVVNKRNVVENTDNHPNKTPTTVERAPHPSA